ncbi:MAG: hypothetical protein J5507_03445 [Clostridia bacterium]|nr:hypothetical protein [Clostridia bacterium]
MKIYECILANVEGKETSVFLKHETFSALVEEVDQKITFDRDGNLLLKKENVCFAISINNAAEFKKYQIAYVEKCTNGEYRILYKKPDVLFV